MRRTLYDLELALTRASLLFKAKAASLHTARFARIDEIQNLVVHTLETENSLLLGRHRYGTTLRVTPSPIRREL